MELHCIPNVNELEEYLKFANEYQAAFEYNEFFSPDLLDDPIKCNEIIQIYKKNGHDRSRDTLHGVFYDIQVHSSDKKIRSIADDRIHQSMEIAMELGVRAVIFHTNTIPELRGTSYEDHWLKYNTDYWENLLHEYKNVDILIENMFDTSPSLLSRLADGLKEEDRFGVCLDISHAHMSGTPIKEWIRNLSPYTKHLHLNDNDGSSDSHNEVGNGSILWEQINPALKQMDQKPSVLIEVKGIAKLVKSVQYMKERSIYPFE